MDENRLIAEQFGLLAVDEIGAFALVRDQKALVPYAFAKQKRLLPVEIEGEKVTVEIGRAHV